MTCSCNKQRDGGSVVSFSKEITIISKIMKHYFALYGVRQRQKSWTNILQHWVMLPVPLKWSFNTIMYFNREMLHQFPRTWTKLEPRQAKEEEQHCKRMKKETFFQFSTIDYYMLFCSCQPCFLLFLLSAIFCILMVTYRRHNNTSSLSKSFFFSLTNTGFSFALLLN